MSIFTKPNHREIPYCVMIASNRTPDLSVIASGMKIVGDIESTGVVKIEGTVEGSIRGARSCCWGDRAPYTATFERTRS
jgi:hypothetical protein